MKTYTRMLLENNYVKHVDYTVYFLRMARTDPSWLDAVHQAITRAGYYIVYQ